MTEVFEKTYRTRLFEFRYRQEDENVDVGFETLDPKLEDPAWEEIFGTSNWRGILQGKCDITYYPRTDLLKEYIRWGLDIMADISASYRNPRTFSGFPIDFEPYVRRLEQAKTEVRKDEILFEVYWEFQYLEWDWQDAYPVPPGDKPPVILKEDECPF